MRAFDAVLRALGRLRLWQQFAALGLLAVVVPITLTTRQFSEQGRRILVAHETVDLADEATLRVNEIRDEFNYLLVDVAQEARALIRGGAAGGPEFPAAAAHDRLRAFAVQFAGRPAADKPLLQARRQYMGGTLVGAYVVPVDPRHGASPVDTAWEAAPDPAVGPVLAELAGRVRAADPSNITRLHPDPPAADRPGHRCLVGAGWAAWYGPDRRPTHLFAVVVDFTAYMRNRQATSPRHYYFVADAAGRLLVGPDRVRPDGDRLLPAEPLWPYTERERELAGDAGSADRRKAAMLRNNGVTLTARPVPELTAYYVKGPFAAPLAAVHPRPADAEAAVENVNAVLALASRADPLLRYGELTADSKYVELSHPDGAALRRATAGFATIWRGAGAAGDIDWSDPLLCETYQGQLTYLNLDPNAPNTDEPPRLVVAASTEELSADIDARFRSITRSRVVPVVAVAGLLTVGLVFALTLSIGRLARTAQTLADPATPAVIDGGGSREVTLLADALAGVVGRLRDTAARFQTILRTAGEGVVVATRDGVIEEANRAAARMFGYADPQQMAGVPVPALVSGPFDLAAAGAATAAGQPGGAEVFQGVRQDGSTFWLEANLRVVDLQDRQVVTGVFRDVTQRRVAEEQIKQLNADLESRVAVRTAELAEANTKLEVALRQAEAAGRAKDAFVANMSHELRQPLHIIIGFTEAIKEEAADAGTAGLVPDLDKILAAARHLLDLINDILDLAKIAAGKMELAPGRVDLARLVADVRDLVGPLAEKNRNAFVVDAPPGLGTMTADERRVRQMLLNLLSNAFKFTADGTVTLSVRKAERAGRRVVEFAVGDTGQGMSPEQRGRLFQRFYQADDATTRVQGGTGLGLAITQSFNEVMGGDPIEVTSEEGAGSRFVVRLPEGVAPPALVAPKTPPVPALPPTAGETVLVIDDDASVRELMSRFLTKEGFRVVEAATGADGLRLARDLQPAAVTLDVMMPGVDGWAVLADLKADPATADIPVVMLTIVDDRGRGYALGAADYLTKPIDWPRLAGILKRYRTPAADRPVLVVDDDAESRQVIRRFLEREGWRVTEAADGEAGLVAVAAERPGLVLLDLMMPVLDGFGFLTELPKRFPAGRPPVVVLTAKDLTADDFDRLNGRVTRILEKGDLAQFDSLAALVRAVAAKGRGI